MGETRIRLRLNAPRARVYQAFLDPRAVQSWMVPAGMRSEVHAFDAREGGAFRISLSYDAPVGAGKTSAHTDTYHGRFVKLIPDQKIVEVLEFETEDSAMRGQMTITVTLAQVSGGATELMVVHADLPSGLSPADNEKGWRSSLERLAKLVDTA